SPLCEVMFDCPLKTSSLRVIEPVVLCAAIWPVNPSTSIDLALMFRLKPASGGTITVTLPLSLELTVMPFPVYETLGEELSSVCTVSSCVPMLAICTVIKPDESLSEICDVHFRSYV